MADFFNKIVYTDSTGEEITLDQSTSVATVDESTLSVAEAQHAANADHATNADNATNAGHATSADSATKATQDGNGNNIVSTYATQSALASGLNGKANTSGTYSGLIVGEATTAEKLDTAIGKTGFSLVTLVCNKWTFSGNYSNTYGQIAFSFICRTSLKSSIYASGGKSLTSTIIKIQKAGIWGRFLATGTIRGETALYIAIPQAGSAILHTATSNDTYSDRVIQSGVYDATISDTAAWDF